VARGDALLDPAVTPSVIGQFAALPTPRDDLKAQDELTAREREVLSLMASGLSNAEIAGELVLSKGTVKTHVRHVLHKLGLRDRIHAVILRVRVGTAPDRLHRAPDAAGDQPRRHRFRIARASGRLRRPSADARLGRSASAVGPKPAAPAFGAKR
jgi:DNA-binding CsgD family transcriptional regulator